MKYTLLIMYCVFVGLHNKLYIKHGTYIKGLPYLPTLVHVLAFQLSVADIFHFHRGYLGPNFLLQY
jgi:hypothetical protein